MTTLQETVESIDQLTRRLIVAAEAGDTDALGPILEHRGAALALLPERLAENGGVSDARRREYLETISLQANEADIALNRLRTLLRDGLLQLAGHNKLLSGYDGRQSDPSSLDRAG